MRSFISRLLTAAAGSGMLLASTGFAGAEQPHNWQVYFQAPVTPMGEQIQAFNSGVLAVMALIALFVLVLLIIVITRFNAKTNPVASRTSHNTLVEVVWTVVPVLILVGIAIPSFSLLFAAADPARAIPGYDPAVDKPMTVKATGSQWSWNYSYPDNGGFSYDSYMLQDSEITDKTLQPRLLAVDNALVVPVGKVVIVQVTSNDVLHSFSVPSFGMKIDAVPGRLNQTWFRADKEGVYYGNCSQLCGNSDESHGHAFMPIEVRVVSQEQFDAFATAAKVRVRNAFQALGPVTTP